MSLHDRLVAELDRLTEIAKAATPGPWRTNVYGVEFEAWSEGAHRRVGTTFEVSERDRLADVRLITTFADPVSVLRGLDEDRDILRRHAPLGATIWTVGQPQPVICASEWADGDGWVVPWVQCPEVLSVARRLGINPEEPTHG